MKSSEQKQGKGLNFNEKLKELKANSNLFDQTKNHTKEKLLYELSLLRIDHIASLIEYHQLLLFHIAYPSGKNTLSLAQAELIRIAGAVKEIKNGKNARLRTQLANTGIANSQLNVSFSFHLIKWLMEKFPNDVELFTMDADVATLEQVLCACLPAVERDLIADKMLSQHQMIDRLKRDLQHDLEFLAQLFTDVELPVETKDVLWDALKIFITWKLDSDSPSLTTARSVRSKIFFHKVPLRKKFNAFTEIKKPINSPSALDRAGKNQLITTGRGVLAMFLRETDPATYADEDQISLFNMGRGIEIALYPMIPERRLPLESYIGYVAFKNGVPVAYGGGWIFLHRCKIGINIFPAFRGGESSFLFCQVLRLYHQYYKVIRFIIEPYQIGKNNMEALRSGAFWFYYRLGFKSSDEDIQKFALTEFQKITTIKKYRSPLSAMRKLAKSNLELILVPEKSYPDADPLNMSKEIADFVNEHFAGKRSDANAWALAELFKWMPKSEIPLLNVTTLKPLNDLALFACVINHKEKLSEKSKSSLLKTILLKGGKDERNFILQMQQNWLL